MKSTTTLPSKIAILLAVYNGMQYLEEQIATILAQIEVELTIFISIDKSTDGSEAWLEALAANNPEIVLLPQGISFGSAGKNFFRLIKDVDFTSFDYIAFADQDDHWYENKLVNAINTLKNTSSDGYSSNVTILWPDGRQALLNKAQPQKKWDYLFEAAGPGCTYVMTRRQLQAIKENLLKNWDSHQNVSLHDWYCYAFARANGFNWIIDREPSMLYRQHANNEIGVNQGLKAAKSRINKIRNGWWLNQALLIARLVGLEEHPFTKSWSTLGRLDMLRLSRHAFQCRRNVKEQFLFLFICLMLACKVRWY